MGHTLAKVPYTTQPRFEAEANAAIRQLMTLPLEAIAEGLKVKPQLAAENARRYAEFFTLETPQVPALLAYTGIVFQQIGAADFNTDDFDFAQKHLWITSFLYGLLRPLDLIKPYRLEGDFRLPHPDSPTRFEYWRPLLTNLLIEATQVDDGILVNLASAEMKRLFDWKRVVNEVKVVTPDFRTIVGDRERNIVVYTKMSRGQLTRHLLKQQLNAPEQLAHFEPLIDGAAVVLKLN